jgi:6,7-dimethyl-8-ribityllumazine synthase
MKVWQGKVNADGFRVAIVVSRFNEIVTEKLLSGAIDSLKRHGVDADHIEIAKVPGCFELPVVSKKMIRQGRFDALISLGCVIRGETSHYDLVCKEVASGMRSLSQELEFPVGFGVVTAENLDQALNRAGGKAGNKGSEAAEAALDMASLFNQLKQNQ